MFIFTVFVESSTYDAVKEGIVCAGVSKVTVLADDEIEASLIATQMVACTRVMPTKAEIDWEAF